MPKGVQALSSIVLSMVVFVIGLIVFQLTGSPRPEAAGAAGFHAIITLICAPLLSLWRY